MTPEEFVTQLDGFIEINGGELPTEAQWKAITDKLGSVFQKKTPDRRKEPIRNCGKAGNVNITATLNPTYCSQESSVVGDVVKKIIDLESRGGAYARSFSAEVGGRTRATITTDEGTVEYDLMVPPEYQITSVWGEPSRSVLGTGIGDMYSYDAPTFGQPTVPISC